MQEILTAILEDDLPALKDVIAHRPRAAMCFQEIDSAGWLPLHYAAQFGSVDLVKYVLDHTTNTALIQAVNVSTPLHVAVQYNQREDVLNLLCTRLRRFRRVLTPQVGLPLHVAALHRKEEIVFKLLLEGDCCSSRLCYAVDSHIPNACDEMSPFALLLQQNGTSYILRYMVDICPIVLCSAVARTNKVDLECFDFIVSDSTVELHTGRDLVNLAVELILFGPKPDSHTDRLLQKFPRFILHAALRMHAVDAFRLLTTRYPHLLGVHHPNRGTCLHIAAMDSTIPVYFRLEVVQTYAQLSPDTFIVGLLHRTLPVWSELCPLYLTCTAFTGSPFSSSDQFLVFKEIFQHTHPALHSSIILYGNAISAKHSLGDSANHRAEIERRAKKDDKNWIFLGSPLHLACEANMPIEFIQSLVEFYPQWCCEPKMCNGMYPLHSASLMHDDVAVVEYLYGMFKLPLSKFSLWWGLPCHCAVIGGRAQNLQFLLSQMPKIWLEMPIEEWMIINSKFDQQHFHRIALAAPNPALKSSWDTKNDRHMVDDGHAYLLWFFRLNSEPCALVALEPYTTVQTSLTHLVAASVAQGHVHSVPTLLQLLKAHPNLCTESLPWNTFPFWCRRDVTPTSMAHKLDQSLSAAMVKVFRDISEPIIPYHFVAMYLFALRLNQKRSTPELTQRIDLLLSGCQALLAVRPSLVWSPCSTSQPVFLRGRTDLLTFALSFAQYLQLVRSDGTVLDPLSSPLWTALSTAHRITYTELMAILPIALSRRPLAQQHVLPQICDRILSFVSPDFVPTNRGKVLQI